MFTKNFRGGPNGESCRPHRGGHCVVSVYAGARQVSAAPRVRLRVAQLSDAAPVAALLKRESPGLKARSEDAWRWLSEENPAHSAHHPAPPLGWVLERGDDICGYLGNIRLDYVLDGKPVAAATCTSYYVRPDARGESARLMRAFFDQPGVELFLTTTANEQSAPVYRLFKSEAPRDSSFAEGLMWIGDDAAAMVDVTCAAGLPRAAGKLMAFGAPVAHAVRTVTGFAHPGTRSGGATVRKVTPAELGPQFDRFFARMTAQPGLRVKRDVARLRWYFTDPDAVSTPEIFALARGDDIAGYALVARCQSRRDVAAGVRGQAITQLRFVDLLVEPGQEAGLRALVCEVVAHGRKNGIGFVYAPPCGTALARELKRLRPSVYRRPGETHFLRTRKLADLPRVVAPGVWDATGLDGDTPL